MKIKNSGYFWTGFVLLLFVYIPFSHLGLSEKYKIENCDILNGTVEQITDAEEGIIIKLHDGYFKIRIIGEFYNALDKDKFFEFVKPNTKLKIYVLKRDFLSFTDKLNYNLRLIDAVIIQSGNQNFLTIKRIKEQLKNTYYFNLIIGIIACLVGLGFVLASISFKRSSQRLK